MLFDRPLVLGPDEVVRLEILEPRAAVLVVDGVTVAHLDPGSAVECRPGPHPARLVAGPRSFHAIVRAKFHLADR
jgi:NAD kinase